YTLSLHDALPIWSFDLIAKIIDFKRTSMIYTCLNIFNRTDMSTAKDAQLRSKMTKIQFQLIFVVFILQCSSIIEFIYSRITQEVIGCFIIPQFFTTCLYTPTQSGQGFHRSLQKYIYH